MHFTVVSKDHKAIIRGNGKAASIRNIVCPLHHTKYYTESKIRCFRVVWAFMDEY